MSFLKEDNRVLVILDNEISINDITDFSVAIKKRLKNPDQLITVSTKELEKCSNSSSYEVIVSIFTRTCPKPEMFLEECLRILKPVGTFIIYELIQKDHPHSAYDKRTSSLKLAGFRVKSPNELNTKELKECLRNVYKDVNNICEIVAEKPSFEIGSSVTLNFGEKKSANVWKLDSDDDEELIDENDLLDEDDIVKPDATSLRVCSTTGKRKACKDCTCGLAEELSGKVALEDTAKSSCGNCYLGDAFRCSACPYLGMPAFKPGEKIVLPASQLKVD